MAVSAEGDPFLSAPGRLRRAQLIRPGPQAPYFFQFTLTTGMRAGHDCPEPTVDRDLLPRGDPDPTHDDAVGFDGHGAHTNHRRYPPRTSDDGRMADEAADCRDETTGFSHSRDVGRRRLASDQDHRFATGGAGDRVVDVGAQLADRPSR